ncbi:MAG: hypothetical protein M1419_03295 [Bacteroidetes bacterium]|nr:hypothetical protein [Bacteroidota bacterium]
MFTIKKKIRTFVAVFSVCFQIIFLFSCGESEPDPPKITGCNEFKYDGYTYGICDCRPGVKSFDCSSSVDNYKYTFHIECKNGCISSVVVKKGSNAEIVSPNQ